VPGTSVDYTFQNAPQLDLTDLACAGAGVTTITSAVGGFTAAMVGNIIKIHAGANFLTEFFEIVTVNSGNSVTLDRTPATGIGANGHGKVGGGQINCDLIDSVAISGNIVYIASGIYAAHPAVSFVSLYTIDTGLTIKGYINARTAIPTGNDRPLLQMGANKFTLQNYVKVTDIRFTGTADGIITTSGNNLLQSQFIRNCKIENLAAVGTVSCILNLGNVTLGYGSLVVIDCEFLGTAGSTSTGIFINLGTATIILNCYFHNLSYGFNYAATDPLWFQLCIFFSIFANILIDGVRCGAGARIVNCTFASIGNNGITASSGYGVLINNSFSDCVNLAATTGFYTIMNNNYFGCGGLIPAGGINNSFAAPQFVTPGSNYALQRTSGLIDKAFSMRLGV
jgi:hypothetical protein